MAKPVLKKVARKKLREIANASLDKERVRGADGKFHTVYRIDAGSGQFDVLFSKAFKLSVAKARKENKRLTGSPDVASSKS